MSAFRHRDFTIFWIGALLSNIGTWLQGLTIPYVIFEVTGSALWVGAVSAAQFIPQVVLSPIGGSLADRYSRRRLLLMTQSALGLTAALLWLAWLAGVREPLALLAFIAVGGIFNGLNVPSWQAFVSDLVPREDLRSAITMNSLQFNAARAIGPGIAGVLLALLGPAWAFGINAASYACVLAALLAVRALQAPVRSAADRGLIRQFGDAIRYTAGQPGLVMVLIVSVLVGLLGNPVFGFTVVFAGSVYHVGAVALGLLNVAFGVGAVLAAPIVSGAWWPAPRSQVVRFALFGYAAAMIVFAVAPWYPIGLAALVGVGGGFLAVIASVQTSLQTIAADHYRGRVLALRLTIFTLTFPVGGLVQGALADLIGPQTTVLLAGLVLLAAATVLALLRGNLRLARLDDPHDESTA